MIQKPYPGEHILLYRGDTIEFNLSFDGDAEGKAFLRTNLENASVRREEIIYSARSGKPLCRQDWHDIPLERKSSSRFSTRLALLEEGHFEAKCFYIQDEESEPRWSDGPNVHINVEPSSFCCANSIYCAFVRQFGINKNYKQSKPIPQLEADEIAELDRSQYTVIPPSGTFRALKNCLNHIVDDLNCRIIHLLPINPTPTVYGRMGRYGSPYASLDFTGIDPALAEFDRKATPLDQFLELVDAIHRKNAKIFLDIAANHTGWAAKIHETNPDWLLKDPDGSIRSPGAWGVVWGDLTELHHNRTDLWEYLADAFLTWCGRGVDGFRCDAGYMIPEKAWEFIIARVRSEYPGTIFLLEGLGGDPEITKRLLDNANMNWAYSELFQNYSRKQIEGYLPYAHKISLGEGIMVHYAETHDNNRLATVSEIYAKMRTSLCALSSNNGAFGFTNGVEWFAKEKIDVHESNALAWGNENNQVAHISRLNTILIAHQAFYNGSRIRIIDSGNADVVAFVRHDSKGKMPLLILVNLNCEKPALASWPKDESPSGKDSLIDLISEENFVLDSGKFRFSLKMSPGRALCLSPRAEDLRKILDTEEKEIIKPDKISIQNATATSLDIIAWRKKSCILIDENPQHLAEKLLDNPYNFCREIFPENDFCRIIEWRWPEDVRKITMIPPEHFIMIRAPYNFRARIADENGKILIQRDSLKAKSGFNFALMPPLKSKLGSFLKRKINISVYADDKSYRENAELLLLPEVQPGKLFVKTSLKYDEISKKKPVLLSVNGRGGFACVPVHWGELKSRYDCILAGNLNTNYPEDRHIMWTRSRICTDYHGRKEWFTKDKVESFKLSSDGNSGLWLFSIPLGNGIFAKFALSLTMVWGKNQSIMTIKRLSAALPPDDSQNINILDDKIPLKLIIRPDIEDRNFHHETKAYLGPENTWQNQTAATLKSFVFEPSENRKLCLSTNKGKFRKSGEWSYAVFRQNEAERGLDPKSDLFSPGYFEVFLGGDEQDTISAAIITDQEPDKPLLPDNLCKIPETVEKIELSEALLLSINKFIVKRDDWKTIIAGYPWFIDWGRDTLIASRALISAEKYDEVKKIISLFAKFAENGTIPNMIMGANASNRDTSDAPLWLFIAVKDFCEAKGNDEILSMEIDSKRNLLSVLKDIAKFYIQGTANGIKMDPESGLIFSPSHFTWMDTNYPAATPREGYPVEIQAFWISALDFLRQKTEKSTFGEIKERALKSFKKFYPLQDPLTGEFEWLSDCLHCPPGKSAAKAVKDDHLRPNQLLAITLGVLNGEEKLPKGIIRACSELLIPGAIRSLADRPTKYELPVIGSSGNLLNNPSNPYFGHYEGHEDSSRKPAYHNGTAWTWLFPSYAEALVSVYGEQSLETARAILSSSVKILEDGAVCDIPEILDGNFPHRQRGCCAQAWGTAELFRVWKIINGKYFNLKNKMGEVG